MSESTRGLAGDLGADLGAGSVGGHGPRLARTGHPALLLLLDRGDQLALAHAGRAGDAQRRGHALQLRQQHRGQTAARTATAGRARGLLRRRDVRDVRRHVGGVAQWIPSPS